MPRLLAKVGALVRAQAALLRARRRLKFQPIGSLTVRGRASTLSPTGDAGTARFLARAVTVAADSGLFRPYCLVRSLALQDLLERAGIEGSQIRVGVRHTDGAFAAHAWVRWGDVILGDDPAHVATFTEVDDIRVLGDS